MGLEQRQMGEGFQQQLQQHTGESLTVQLAGARGGGVLSELPSSPLPSSLSSPLCFPFASLPRLSDPINSLALLSSAVTLPTWVNYVSSTLSLHGFVPVTPEAEAPRCAKAASRCFSLRCDRHKVLTWEWMGASCYLRLGAALKRPV
ncbi:unnamed protein product [Pleuronectes platessa]|uniref:Uncharacterized protein n=1 Tax=Pleuronectes platessa TaxID=8262 RepID=A0A9N7V460_PLEPL|nr:unnamed protein product [Pleuronectes platessa]